MKGLKIVFPHLFGHDYRDIDILTAIMKEYRAIKEEEMDSNNIYVDISGTLPFYDQSPEANIIAWHLRKFGIDHILFGSDYPIDTPTKAIQVLKQIPLTQEELREILVTNVEKLLR